MKKTIITILQLVTLTLPAAALPEDWEVDLAAKQPQVFTLQRPRGETYELKAVLKRHGKPFEPAITNACIYWQTNGMENLYWSAPASVSNNVLRATWLPSMDPGATTVRGYIGDPGHIYAAAFQFRFIASPGPLPNALPLPTPVIDFSRVRVLNPPWGSGGGGGCDTNAVDALANSAVVTNALTVATTNRVAALETATNNLSSSVSSLASSKADKSALNAHVANTRNPHKVTAEQVGSVSILPEKSDQIIFNWADTFGTAIRLYTPYYKTGIGLSVDSIGGELINYHDDTYDWYQFPTGKSGTLAVVDDISVTNPTFANAVLAVNVDFATNTTGAAYVAVTNALAGFGLDAEALAELPGGKVYGSIGALLAALAAAVAWLKKKALVGGLTGGVPDDPKVHDFFTESNSLLNGRLAYSRNATGLKDRAFNTLSFDGTEFNLSTALAAVTPTASGQPRDLLIVATATAATTISFTAGTIKGDKPTIDGSGTWLITLTEYASGVWYCRQIKMEDAA